MARHECTRCGATTFDSEGEHICKDIAKRLAKRERQVRAVEKVLDSYAQYDNLGNMTIIEIGPDDQHDVAQDIVKALANMQVDED